MKTVAHPELKALIFNLVHYVDDVDLEGKPVRRTIVKRDHSAGASKIIKAIKDDMLVLVKKDSVSKPKEQLTMGDVDAVKVTSLTEEQKKNVVGESFDSTAIVFDEKMIDALKWFYSDRKEWPMLNDAEAVESLLKELVG